MSSGQPEKSTELDQVYAEAYRSYLRSLREGLANLDIDALDLSGVRAPASPGTALFSIGCQAGNALFSIGCQAGTALFSIGPQAAGSPGSGNQEAGAQGTLSPDDTTS
jgi:hypothetical protein